MPTTGYPLGSPFGTGVPEAAEPAARGAVFSRYVTNDGDYAIDPGTGRYAEMPPVRQRISLGLRHLKDSSSELPDGIVYPRKMSIRLEQEMDVAVRRVFFRLTEIEKLATIDEVITERQGTGRVIVTVVYTDLTTGEQDKHTFEY